ncbi:MAG TPA: hypothetical protein VGQ87_01635 [Patescibacteria group bacterium]|nr:hypothetical protein [Patescibacteria group bacterium]
MRKTIQFYTAVLYAALAASVLLLVLIVSQLDPTGSTFSLILFYFDLFIFVLSLSTLLSFHMRKLIGQPEQINNYLKTGFRQGIWFAMLIVVSMILQSFGLFSLFNAIFLVVALVFLESYFLYNK